MPEMIQKLKVWHLVAVLAAIGALGSIAHIAFFTFAPQSLLPHLSNGLVDPYAGVYATCIELVVGIVLAASLSLARDGDHKVGQGFAFWLALTAGYLIAGVGLGLATGAYG